jgi:hypothetical protein
MSYSTVMHKDTVSYVFLSESENFIASRSNRDFRSSCTSEWKANLYVRFRAES